MEPLCLCLCADSISAGGMRSPSSPRPSREESASRPTTLWGKTAAFRCSTLSSSEYWREFPCSDGPEDCQETADLSSWPCLLFVLLISHVFAEFQTCFCPSVKTRWGQQRGQRWFTTREKPPNSESASRIVSSSSSSSCFCFVRRLYLLVFSFFFFYFLLCDLCSQLLPTARTGCWPPTTPACPSCTLARTSSACSTSSSPGSSAGLASCLRRPWVTPRSCWWTKGSTCSGWRTRIRRAARTTRDPRRLVNQAGSSSQVWRFFTASYKRVQFLTIYLNLTVAALYCLNNYKDLNTNTYVFWFPCFTKLKLKIFFRPFLCTETSNFTQILSTNLLKICVTEHFAHPKIIHLLDRWNRMIIAHLSQ